MADQGAIGTGAGLFSTAAYGVGGYVVKFAGLWQNEGVSPYYTPSQGKDNKFFVQWSDPLLFLSLVYHTATLKYDGTISGTFLDASSQPINWARVRLYRRSTGQLVDQTRTAADGTYSFSKMMYDEGLYTKDYFVVFFDPAGGTVYNDILESQFTPGA
jgi:hypothetical protein